MMLQKIDINDLAGIALATLAAGAIGVAAVGLNEDALIVMSGGFCGACLWAIFIGRIHR